MIDEQSRSLSGYRLNKAKTLLTQAELLLTNHQYDGSINRSYYSIFNAVRALLALVRIDKFLATKFARPGNAKMKIPGKNGKHP